MKKLAILFGGKSSEYEVSLQSAFAVLEALDKEKYEVIKIGIDQTGDWYLFSGENQAIKENRWCRMEVCKKVFPAIGKNHRGFIEVESRSTVPVDILFPMMHGEFVEDGRIQGIFEWMGLPYVGCKTAASALCMNKMLTHRFANSLEIATTPSLIGHLDNLNHRQIERFIRKVGFPLFVKPLKGGSSKGITKVKGPEELTAAFAESGKIDRHFILEKAVEGVEVGCGILGNQELVIGGVDEIELQTDFFDYTEKYQLLSAAIHLPARISVNLQKEVQYQAERLYRMIGCQGLARIDFFLTQDGELLLNEINTMPGFTAHSRYPNMLKSVGYSYQELIEKLIELAEEGER